MPLIRIGTSEQDGTFHSQGRALKAMLDRRPALAPVDVLTSASASIENANRLDEGAIEFGFMASNWIGRANNGEAPFTRPLDIRMAAPMNAGPLFFVTRADAAIYTIADLRGRRVALGMAGSGMVQHAHVIFGVLGLGFADFTPVYLDFAAGADALASGAVDAQFQCPIPNKVMRDLAARVPLRVLSYAPVELAAVVAAVPHYRDTVIRKGAIENFDQDVAQVAVINVLATHARVADTIVRETVAAIVSDADELARLNPLFHGLSDLFAPLRRQGAAALEFGGVALHPGAVAAYRDAGLLG
jgi:TRAP transporter TAXI family solute receptor